MINTKVGKVSTSSFKQIAKVVGTLESKSNVAETTKKFQSTVAETVECKKDIGNFFTKKNDHYFTVTKSF